jgi:hypothetical protein
VKAWVKCIKELLCNNEGRQFLRHEAKALIPGYWGGGVIACAGISIFYRGRGRLLHIGVSFALPEEMARLR